jgi:hypothetical protein
MTNSKVITIKVPEGVEVKVVRSEDTSITLSSDLRANVYVTRGHSIKQISIITEEEELLLERKRLIEKHGGSEWMLDFDSQRVALLQEPLLKRKRKIISINSKPKVS